MIVLRSKSFAKFKAKDLTPEIEDTLKEIAANNLRTYDGFLGENFTKFVDIKKGKYNGDINSSKAKAVRAVRESLRRAGK